MIFLYACASQINIYFVSLSHIVERLSMIIFSDYIKNLVSYRDISLFEILSDFFFSRLAAYSYSVEHYTLCTLPT